MMIEALRAVTREAKWPILAQSILAELSPQHDFTESFSTYWIEAGHVIRGQIADDCVLVRLLRHLLSPYQGGAITLFRGENLERLDAGKLGLCWSSNIDVARMFGRGLNSFPGGGVLLRAHFEPQAIICGPNNHSQYLGEGQYTIDTFNVVNKTIVEQYPPAD